MTFFQSWMTWAGWIALFAWAYSLPSAIVPGTRDGWPAGLEFFFNAYVAGVAAAVTVALPVGLVTTYLRRSQSTASSRLGMVVVIVAGLVVGGVVDALVRPGWPLTPKGMLPLPWVH